MSFKKMLVIVVAAAFLATPAFAGTEPEIDTVGVDLHNRFVLSNWVRLAVALLNVDGNDNHLNAFSFWRSGLQQILPNNTMEPFFRGFPYADEWGEKFASGSGACFPDPCFDDLFRFDGEIGHGYRSVLTDTWNPGSYDWWIILQMKPESDIDLNIRDCVLKHNAAWLYPQQPHLTPHNAIPAVRIAAEQTGRYRASNGQLMFVPTVNPKVTVEAYPGPYATFSDSFVLDYRSMPGLKRCSLEDACYTSKAMWEEGIVIALPETGTANANGHPCFLLKQGDQIRVHIEIPMGHPADIYYGPDNVSLKYIGICGTEFNSLVYPHCNPWNPELTPGCNDDQFQNCDEAFDICPTLTLQP